MRKKAIIILLCIPFIVAVLAFVTSSYIIRQVEQDINGISFTYRDNEAFLLANGEVTLEAEQAYDKNYPLADGNDLVWESSSDCLKIEKRDNNYYMMPLEEGKAKVVCRNEKGNVSRSFNAYIVGDDGAIIVNPVTPFNTTGIDAENYILGLYDLKYNSTSSNYIKENSSLKYTVEIVGTDLVSKDDLVIEASSNVTVRPLNNEIRFKSAGKVEVKFSTKELEGNDYRLETIFDFEIKDAVNIYNYNDLLMATNYSNTKENICMRVNLESLANTYKKNSNGEYINEYLKSDTKLFGNYDFEKKKFNFEEEIYTFITTYNHEFIDQFNEYTKTPEGKGLEEYDLTIKAGIHIKGDFYGNGYTINFANLAFPTNKMIVDNTEVYVPSKTDLFRGPRIFLSLGVPKTKYELTNINEALPMYALYGQDNIGMYAEGDNINIINAHLKNSDYTQNAYNLEYTGTVLELAGDNITVKNSILENGRNIIRAYSCDNLLIDNCYINNALEYGVKLGSNVYEHVDSDAKLTYEFRGKTYNTSKGEFLKQVSNFNDNSKADTFLTNGALAHTPGFNFFSMTNPDDLYSDEDYIKMNEVIKEALMNESFIYNSLGQKDYDATVTVNDTYFYKIGLSSITIDSMAQGGYLQSNITSLFDLLLFPYLKNRPKDLAFTPKPIKLNIEGDTAFYDYKNIDDLNYSTTVFQDIKTLLEIHGGISGIEVIITDDDYLPLRMLLKKNYSEYLIENNINPAIFIEGGGYNASDIVIDEKLANAFIKDVTIDPYLYSLSRTVDFGYDDFNTNAKAKYETMKVCMLRASMNVFGFNEYKYFLANSIWYGQVPNIQTLKDRA